MPEGHSEQFDVSANTGNPPCLRSFIGNSSSLQNAAHTVSLESLGVIYKFRILSPMQWIDSTHFILCRVSELRLIHGIITRQLIAKITDLNDVNKPRSRLYH